MKKHGILNSEISKVLSDLGHTDSICIADAGLPIPEGVRKIDISLKKGLPSFLDTLTTILDDMWIENVYLAEEIKTMNKSIHEEISRLLPGLHQNYVSHSEFKAMTKSCKVIIRTGEMTPFANIILTSNVNFEN